MKAKREQYTYRGGKKIMLVEAPDEFVVRANKEQLSALGLDEMERTSPASFRVKVAKSQLNETMDRVRKTAVAHHAYYTEDGGQEYLISDRVIVGFKKPISNESLDKFMAAYSLIKREKYSDKEFLFQLTEHTGMNPIKLVVLLTEKEPLVEYAENDLNSRTKKYAINPPTDTYYKKQWHLHTHFTNAEYDPRCSTRCEEAWELLGTLGSSDVVVAVTDDGCKLDHPDFDSPGKFAAWGYMKGSRLISSADIDADPSKMYDAGVDANHGTSCAGVIAGEADGILTVGAAPGCKLLPIKWESSGDSLEISDSKFITVLNFLADKADVLSNSWGNTPDSIWSTPVVNKIKNLASAGGKRGKGILILWASGNENCPINLSGNKKIPYTDGWNDDFSKWLGVKTSKSFSNNFAGIPGVMHIAAISSMAQRSHYSNYGQGIDLCAPSNNVHEYQRINVKGLGISTDTGEGSGYTNDFGGTSSATPLTAGIAALVISANPNLKAVEVEAILKQTASRDLNMQGYNRTRATAYDPDTSWDISPVAPYDKGDFKNISSNDGTWSPWFGYGKADACEAVRKALSLTGGQQVNVVKIISALVDPEGTDAGKEKISLLNTSAATIPLSNWSIEVKGKKQTLNGAISGGEAQTIVLDPSKIKLTNTGAGIILYNGQQQKIHEVNYNKSQVKKGITIQF